MSNLLFNPAPLRRFRTEKEWSTAKMAEELGLETWLYEKYESGHRSPTRKNAYHLAMRFMQVIAREDAKKAPGAARLPRARP